jgi:hypothetical protein
MEQFMGTGIGVGDPKSVLMDVNVIDHGFG